MMIARKGIALMILGSVTMLGVVTPEAVASDIRISYRSSSYDHGYASTAGILVIDGQRITIRSHRNIGRQIVKAFRRCGYDALLHHGKVKVYFDEHHRPRVSWYQRGYRASIYRGYDEMSISWYRIYRGNRNSGWKYRDRCCELWNQRGHHHGRKRVIPRRWCD